MKSGTPLTRLGLFAALAAMLSFFGAAPLCLSVESGSNDSPAPGKGANKENRIEKIGNLLGAAGDKNDSKAGPHEGMVRQFLSSLPEEEAKKLRKLFAENPEAFKEAMQKKMAEFREKRENENKQLNEFVKQYREAGSPEAKAAALQKIKENVSNEFNRRMEENKKRIDDFDKRINELRNQYKERQAKSSEIIDDRIRELTKDPSLHW